MSETKTQLYISNLPAGATSDRLQAAFKKYGEITDAFIPHRGSRFGFVDFSDAAAASKALEMDKKHLDSESKAAAPDEVLGVVRATKRPADKERKPEGAAPAKPVKKEEPRKKDSGAPGAWGNQRGDAHKKPETTRKAPPAAKKDEPKDHSRVSKKALDAVADKFFKALSEQDWESAGACFAPSAQCFSPQRTGAKPQQFIEFRKTMGGMIGLLGKPQYLDVRRLYGSDSVTEQHTTRFAEKKDATVEAEACVLLRINPDGLIVRMDEYLDPTVVLKAVQTASRK